MNKEVINNIIEQLEELKRDERDEIVFNADVLCDYNCSTFTNQEVRLSFSEKGSPTLVADCLIDEIEGLNVKTKNIEKIKKLLG